VKVICINKPVYVSKKAEKFKLELESIELYEIYDYRESDAYLLFKNKLVCCFENKEIVFNYFKPLSEWRNEQIDKILE
jgi:hypothetical protein